MSRAGCPYDNAMAESFMKTLKVEEVDGMAYRDLADAGARIGQFIEPVYNRQRLHSALNYRSPEEFETHQSALQPLSLFNLNQVRGAVQRPCWPYIRDERVTRCAGSPC